MTRGARGEARAGRVTASDRLTRLFTGASRALPLVGAAAIVLAVVVIAVESDPPRGTPLLQQVLRGILFILSSFVGSYVPVPGQGDDPSLLATLTLVLALTTSLGGVALAVVSVFARELALGASLLRRSRVVVVGESDEARTLALRLRRVHRNVITVGYGEGSMIRVADREEIIRDRRVRRALRGARTAYILHRSSVDGALTAAEIRALPRSPKTFQMFDWELDRLVFRPEIEDGRLPQIETFSPVEITGIHLAHLIEHLVRTRRSRLTVRTHGDHQAIAILLERLGFMESVLAFNGGVDFVGPDEDADISVLGVTQSEYVAAVESAREKSGLVLSIAPEQYFAAVGRADLGAVGSREWLADRDRDGVIRSRAEVVLVDETRIGLDVHEVSFGVRDRWAREFHNAHSDFGSRGGATGWPNRWLDSPPHERLRTMARAAVDLMLRDLDQCGYYLSVRRGQHHELADADVETCARHIHDQYLSLTWRDETGTVRRCAEHFVDRDGVLRPMTPPPSWEDDDPQGRERNRAMVRAVYPALAASFGYRITRRRPDASVERGEGA